MHGLAVVGGSLELKKGPQRVGPRRSERSRNGLNAADLEPKPSRVF